MDKWERVPLGTVTREYTKKNKGLGRFPVYSVTNSNGFVVSTDYFDKQVYSKDVSTYKIVRRGGFAYNPSRINVGSIAMLKTEDGIVSPLYVVFETDLNPDFLLHYLKSDQGLFYINANTSGSVRDSLSYKAFSKITIPMPPLSVQQQIVDVLERASTLIEKRKAQIEKLDLLVKSQFIEMFGDPVANPKGWDVGTIRDLVTDVKYGTSKPAEENGQYIYLRMNNVTYSGSIDLSDLKYINVDEKDYEKYVVRKGDVLFNRTNSKELVGKTAVFKEDTPMIIAGYIIRVRTNENANPEYLSAYLNSNYGKALLFDMCKAIVGQANINAQELQNIKIPMTPISLQNEFADFVHQVETPKSLLQKSLAKLEQNYKSLMQKCLRGEMFYG